jgi:NDP-sugar pyrophosphorylase family protein
MKAMVLAGGEGRRLGAATEQVPKPMLPIGGRPLLAHTIDALARHGIRELVINLHHQPDVVRAYFGDGSSRGVSIRYSPEEQLRGTAGALAPWRDFFDDTCLVIYGDNLSTCDFTRLLGFHRAHDAEATVALFWRDDVRESGVADVDEAGRVERFVEKPSGPEASHWVSAGLMVLEPALVGAIPDTVPVDFGRDLLPAWVSAGRRIFGYRMGADEKLWWIDKPADLARVQREFDPAVPR